LFLNEGRQLIKAFENHFLEGLHFSLGAAEFAIDNVEDLSFLGNLVNNALGLALDQLIQAMVINFFFALFLLQASVSDLKLHEFEP